MYLRFSAGDRRRLRQALVRPSDVQRFRRLPAVLWVVAEGANVEWSEQNHTHAFAYGAGAAIVPYGLVLCLRPWLPQVTALGGCLAFVTSFVTRCFLVTTPECWVPPLGDANHGFPFLSGAGRLVIKDAITMGAALVVMADSAKACWRRQRTPTADSQ